MPVLNTIKDEENIRKEIENDFEFNYFVEAGAGAGKTKLVIDRISNQLSSGEYKPEQIVAITFTNKAAQELFGRIYDRLQKEAKKNPSNESVVNALKDIGRMQISTIHSFCHRILTENCFESKLRLDAELLEQEDTTKMQSEFFTKWLTRNGNLMSDFKKQCSSYIKIDEITEAFCGICDLPQIYDFKTRDLSDFDLDKINELRLTVPSRKKKVYLDLIDGLNEGLKQSTEVGMPFYGLKVDDPNLQPYIKTTYKGLSLKSIIDACIKQEPIFYTKTSPKGFSIKKEEKESLARIFDYAYACVESMMESLREDIAFLDEQEPALTHTLITNLLLEARKEYKAQKFNKYLTNDLLLQKTNELLDNKEVTKKLQSTFKCIYLDESQDTDRIQNELIMKIAKKDDEFIPGMLFIVGDVKQSIYRFREADYRLFNATKEVFEANPNTCKVRSLNINNRSNADLVEFYNNKVSSFDTSFPGYQDMIPRHGKRDDTVIHGVYNAGGEKKDYDNVVDLIKHLVGKAKITVFNKEKEVEEVRKVEYSDFLVLVRKAKEMNSYIEAFERASIPVRASVEFLPSTIKPLVRFAHIYRYLAMPYYRRAKEGILGVAQQNPSKDIFCNSDTINKWRQQTKELNGAQLIGWLLERSELYIFDEDVIKGTSVIRYQMTIRQMVDQVLSKTENNAISISNAILAYVSKDNAVDREIGYDKYENAVRFMNIHKAKGLEGNIVIIANRSEVNKKPSSYTDKNDRYQVYCTSFGKKYYDPYKKYPDAGIASNEEVIKENDRLEYVAVTRAKEALIFMPSLSNKETYFDKYTKEAYTNIYEAYPVIPCEESIEENEAKPIIHAKNPDLSQFDQKSFKVSPSGLEIHKEYKPEEESIAEGSKESTIDVDEVFEDDTDNVLVMSDSTENEEPIVKRSYGGIFGTVMHRAYELAIYEMRNGSSRWQLCVNRAINENNDDIDLAYKDLAAQTKEDFHRDIIDSMPRFVEIFNPLVASADEVYTEYPFSLTITGSEITEIKSKLNLAKKIAEKLPKDGLENTSAVWINGKADLIIRKGDTTTVWDYKSDLKVDAETIHFKYDNQMQLYKWVFEKHFGGMVEGKFYSLEVGVV